MWSHVEHDEMSQDVTFLLSSTNDHRTKEATNSDYGTSPNDNAMTIRCQTTPTTAKATTARANKRTQCRGLYSPPGIPPRIPLESRNSAGLIPEFDIPPDCAQNITRMVFYSVCLVSPYRVPLDSVIFEKIPWNVQWNSMGPSEIPGMILM